MINIALKELMPSDVTQDYVGWLNDSEVVAYTEQRFSSHNIDDVRAFVESKLRSTTEFFFGIYVEGEHVGNIKLGPINVRHGTAEVSYIIGNKSFWGRGVGQQAVDADDRANIVWHSRRQQRRDHRAA